MDDIVLVQVVNGVKNLLDSLRRIFLSELAPITDTVEELSSCGQLSDNVEFVLWRTVSRFRKFSPPPSPQVTRYQRTLDSNQSTNLTI